MNEPPPEVRVTGDTFPVRHVLHRLGCEYRRDLRCWVAPDAATATYARQFVPVSPLVRFLRDHDPEYAEATA